MSFWNPIKTRAEKLVEDAVRVKVQELFKDFKHRTWTYDIWTRNMREYIVSSTMKSVRGKVNDQVVDSVAREIGKVFDENGDIRTSLVQQVVDAVNKSQVK